MKYGHFDNERREYVITRPDTPRSWTNYLGDRQYGAVITNHGGGYSFHQSAAQGRFLRLRFNSIPMDQPGRYFYLKDRETNDYWSPGWQPVGKSLSEQETICRHGAAYTILESSYREVAAEVTYFVPLGEAFEYWRLRVTNKSDREKQIEVFTYAEFATNWNIHQDLVNLQYSQYCGSVTWRDGMVRAAVLDQLPSDPDNFSNIDQGRWTYMLLEGADVESYELDRERFIGPYRQYSNPRAVETGLLGNSVADGDNGCGGMKTILPLQPGETREIRVLLGVGKAEEEGIEKREQFGSAESCAREFERLQEAWLGKLGQFQVSSPDKAFDSMINFWNPYNAYITFNWSRAASLIYNGERDGLGYRDSVQDCVAIASLDPETAHDRLVLMLTGQDHNGGALSVVQPFKHAPGKMSRQPDNRYRGDDCLWLFNAIPVYVAESGDVEFYNRIIPFSDEGEATVFEHLRRALEFNWNRRGAQGLPAGLAADWNDCLRLGYEGESLFLAFQLRFGFKTYIDIARMLEQKSEGKWAEDRLAELDQCIGKVAWNGRWFVRAFREDGQVIGSLQDEDGEERIFLNAQVWSILSGYAQEEQRETVLDEMKERLATPYGLMLCTPPYRNVPVDVIRAVVINPGHKENAGIFCHPQGWGVMAETIAGHGNRAYQYFRASMPAAYNEKAEIREIEPYVYSQSTRSKYSERYGTSRIPWLSGTATWSYHAATHHILGIQPEIDGLRIDPCIPSGWETFTVIRLFRGCRLHIEFANPDGVEKGVRCLILNDEELDSNLVPVKRLKEENKVLVMMGPVR